MSRRPLHARGRSVSLQTRRAVGLLAAVAMVASAWGKPAPGPGVSATPSATPAPARRRTSGSPSTASPPSSRRRAATRPLHGSTASSTRVSIALTRRRPEVRQGFRRGGQQGRGPELRLARQV